ncbi:hypothetical protein WJX72_008819 [[Myrmecia] bisecta]|uniref:Uncharacterized protein n=1 Tax=[Myrmecia] bisecta TaxID=41462 RepID=A0AAW1PGR1_9CHLO
MCGLPSTRVSVHQVAMAPLEGLLQSVALQLDPVIDYATLLRASGYRTSEAILAANSAEKLSEDCNLLIGDARILWKAAGGSAGSPVRPRRAFEITIIGPHKKKHLWTLHGQLTLAALQEEIIRHFPDAGSADYTLTWETSNDIIDDFEGTVSQWGEQNKITVDLKLKLLSKGFSDFTRADGLEYLGFSRSYEINEAAETEFTAEELADDAAVNGQTSTFGSLLQHFAEDLCLRRSALGCPETKPSEQTRREIISPVFVLAVLLMTGMRLVAEARVQGSLGNGPLDYAVIWEAFKVLISECKKERLEDGEGQALAQTAAAREEYVRKRVKGIKRKRSEIDKDLPVPSTTILSTGTTYIFYRYHPAAGEAQPRRLIKSKEYTLDLIGPTSPETIKPQLKAEPRLFQSSYACLHLLEAADSAGKVHTWS